MSDLLKALLRCYSPSVDARRKRCFLNWRARSTEFVTGRFAATVALVMLMAAPTLKAATPADPIEVKLRYVVLLSTFIRGNTQNLSACMLSEPLNNSSLESLASKLKYIDTIDDLSSCKSLFIPSSYVGDKDVIREAFSNKSVLIVSDNNQICNLADVFLFQNGKRIFFHVDIKSIKQKTFSVAAQVLALSKQYQCERSEK